MAPSMLKLGTVALAYTFGVSALSSSPVSSKTYQLSESYNSGNFLEKFSFFEGGRGQDRRDPNNGFVQYQSKDAAVSSGLIKTEGDSIRIGVDSKSSLDPLAPKTGRNSVRLESTASYNTGLFIAKFNHFPKPVCGAWPAFWMVGDNWPQDGEVDIYEMWSVADHNRITYHTGTPEQVGECKIIDETHIESSQTRNCDNFADGQWTNEGCGVTETKGQWGNPNGGVYAIEWTEDHISVWSWPTEPTDIENGEPTPETWGKPHMSVTSKTCDVEKAFKNLRFILNINFCGDAAGQLFGLDATCGKKAASCEAYVGENPQDFEDVFWKIQYLDVYQLQQALPTTTSSAISSSTTSSAISSTETSTSTESSSTVTSSFVSVVSSSAVNPDTVSTSALSTSEAVSSSATSSSDVVSSSAVVSASAVPSSEVVSSTDIFSNIISATDASSSSSAVSVTATSSAALPTETDDDSDCDDDDEGDVSSGIVVPSGSATVSIVPSGSVVPSESVISSGSVVPSASAIETGASSIITSAPSGSASGLPVISSSGVVSSGFPISSAPADPSASGGFPVSSAISGPVLFPNSTITASQEYTTSTIYTTSYYTVTSCAPTVTNCPAHVVTSVIAISTTVCPVTNHPAGPTNVPGGGNGVPVVPTQQVPGAPGCNGENCPVPTQVPGGPNGGAPGSGNGNGEVVPPVPTGGAPGSGSGNGEGEGVPPVVPVPSGSAPGTGSGNNGGCTGENCPVPTGSTPGEGEGEVPVPVPTGSAPGTGNGSGSVPPFVPAPPAPTGTLPGGTNGAINGTYSVPPAPVASGTGVVQPPAVPVSSSSPSVSIGQPPIPTEDVPPVTAGAGKNVLSVGVAVVAGVAALLAL